MAFITVVHEGSFAKAAVRLGIGRSAISRSVQRLEIQLQTRLFSRTTRSTSLTCEGQRFYASCKPGVQSIVRSIEEMHEIRSGIPTGQLRISATSGFGRKIVAPLLRGFLEANPGIQINMHLDDGPVTFVDDRIDVAFHDGCMDDSQVVAKQLIPMQMVVCAAPGYLQRHGIPQSPCELEEHHCINLLTASGRPCEWQFMMGDMEHTVLPPAAISSNDPDLVLNAVLNGQGVAQLAGYQVCEHLRAGRLVACLGDYAPEDLGHYVCYLNRRHLPNRIRVFIDYMTQHIRALDLRCSPHLPRLM